MTLRTSITLLLISLGLWAFVSTPLAATNQSITEFPTSEQPLNITAGPDGNLWFTEPNAIGRITTAGAVTEYPLLAGSSNPHAITAGPDGNIWFTLPNQSKVGRITPSGVITEITGITVPMGITNGPDGNVWITQSSDRIAQITTTGIITAFPIAPGSAPDKITLGPDGNLWYVITIVYKDGNQIGRITPTGVYTEFTVPTWDSGITDLTVGRDGNIWFTETRVGKIGRITPTGTVTEFSLSPSPFTIYPIGITAGPDGNIWFAANYPGLIGRIGFTGGIAYSDIPTPDSGPMGITTGADGNIWFTESSVQQIGRLHVYQVFLPLVMRL